MIYSRHTIYEFNFPKNCGVILPRGHIRDTVIRDTVILTEFQNFHVLSLDMFLFWKQSDDLTNLTDRTDNSHQRPF